MKEKLLKIYNSDTALARTQGVVIGLMVAMIIVNAINKIKDWGLTASFFFPRTNYIAYNERMCFVMNQNNNQKNEELSDYITHATNTANEIFKLYGTKVALDAMAQYMVKKPWQFASIKD